MNLKLWQMISMEVREEYIKEMKEKLKIIGRCYYE